MKIITNFFKIIDRQTIIITGLTLLATYLCNHYGISADLPSGLIGIAIIFPIVFSINAAYKRREDVLTHFASIKSHSMAIYYAARDWGEVRNPEFEKQTQNLANKLLIAIKKYLSCDLTKDEKEKYNAVYDLFSQFSLSHENLRTLKISASEISRINQYLRFIIFDFEKMRNIYLYRTPISLRAYSKFFLNIFPLLFSPYFAELCNSSYPAVGYGVAIVYSVVLVSLDNIQENLENPYDEIGEDDIEWDMVNMFRKQNNK